MHTDGEVARKSRIGDVEKNKNSNNNNDNNNNDDLRSLSSLTQDTHYSAICLVFVFFSFVTSMTDRRTSYVSAFYSP